MKPELISGVWLQYGGIIVQEPWQERNGSKRVEYADILITKRCDLDGNKYVDEKDRDMIAKHFGKTYFFVEAAILSRNKTAATWGGLKNGK